MRSHADLAKYTAGWYHAYRWYAFGAQEVEENHVSTVGRGGRPWWMRVS